MKSKKIAQYVLTIGALLCEVLLLACILLKPEIGEQFNSGVDLLMS